MSPADFVPVLSHHHFYQLRSRRGAVGGLALLWWGESGASAPWAGASVHARMPVSVADTDPTQGAKASAGCRYY